MTKIYSMNRRHFLRGVGGFTLPIPFLGSLVQPGKARAQAVSSVQKRLILLASDHGGISMGNILPARVGDWETQLIYPDEGSVRALSMRYTPLLGETRGRDYLVSNTFRASETLLNEALLDKMNVVTGFDCPHGLGHTRGMFGNFAARAGNSGEPHVASIDQVILRSPNFRRAPSRRPYLCYSASYGYSTLDWAPSTEFGPAPATIRNDPRQLWDDVFEGVDTADSSPTRTPVVDRVLAHYRELTQGAFGHANRLSSLDKVRLDDHMERLYEIQRRLANQAAITCDPTARPPSSQGSMEEVDASMDIIGAALACGATHVSTITGSTRRFATTSRGWNDWHQQVAHRGGGLRNHEHREEWQDVLYQSHRHFFQRTFLRLANILNSNLDVNGEPLLDSSLMVYTQESGPNTHDGMVMTMLTAGSAGGYFHTGRFIDYRRLHDPRFTTESSPEAFPGILLQRFLANVMLAMGLGPSEWADEMQRVQPEAYADGVRGYGLYWYHPQNFYRRVDFERDIWPFKYFRDADDPLPGLVVGA